MKRLIPIIKLVTVAAFMVTLCATYYLRSEVLELNKLRYESNNLRSLDDQRQLRESFPLRMQEYKTEMQNYEIALGHYQEMLELYRSDYDAYVKRLKDDYRPPRLPTKPSLPDSPELSDQLAAIDAEFNQRQLNYFSRSAKLNWICCASALLLTGGLLFLIFFEDGKQKFLYVIVMVISFVFMIGPSFHSLMSAFAGLLRSPGGY